MGRLSEEECLLGQAKNRLGINPNDQGNLPRASNDEDRLQACTKRIRIQKYLREKLRPPH